MNYEYLEANVRVEPVNAKRTGLEHEDGPSHGVPPLWNLPRHVLRTHWGLINDDNMIHQLALILVGPKLILR